MVLLVNPSMARNGCAAFIWKVTCSVGEQEKKPDFESALKPSPHNGGHLNIYFFLSVYMYHEVQPTITDLVLTAGDSKVKKTLSLGF